ncbi:type three secretion system effector protein [Burkholderia sp. Bp9126]|nr:type three secretion system effector protein [Burkholderia sp. Bp9126]
MKITKQHSANTALSGTTHDVAVDNSVHSAPPDTSTANNAVRVTLSGNAIKIGAEDISDISREPASEPWSSHISLARNVGFRNLTLEQNLQGSVRLSMNYPDITQLVLSGGGAKGAAYPGAVLALEDHGVMQNIKSISGSSAGAIAASLLASGMSGKYFAELSNNIDFIDLIRHRVSSPIIQAARQAVEDVWRSTSASSNAKFGFGKNIGDIFTILTNIQTDAPALENLIRAESRKIVLEHMTDAEVSHDYKATVDTIRTCLSRGKAVTFGDLRALSRHIPAIKELICTGTMMIKDRPQLAVFNADTTPELDIAKAVCISASLPLIFAQQTQTSSYGTAQYQDGGVMLNVPALSLIYPESVSHALPNPDALILIFKSVPDQPQTPSGLSAMIKDWVTGAPCTAQHALETQGLRDLREQIVQVPLRNERGNFSAMMSGTLNFGMSLDDKAALQRDLRTSVEEHLVQRGERRITIEFSSTDAAILALGNEEFKDLDDSCPDLTWKLHEFRARAREELEKIANAVGQLNRLIPNELEKLIQPLDKLSAGNMHRSEYLARQILDANQPDSLKRIADGMRRIKTDSLTLQTLQKMSERQDVINASRNALRDIIYPARFKLRQTENNHTLLNLTEQKLIKAITRKEYNAALSFLATNYEARMSLLRKPLSSTTVEMANSYQMRE